MRQGLKVLVLAGSAEARQIAAAAQAGGAVVQAVMSQPPKGPNPMPVPYVLLDEISPDQMRAAMAGCDAVVDASHGFDGAMTHAGFQAASALGLPMLGYARAPWCVEGQEGWQSASSVAEAMGLVEPGARVFSAAGWASLPECAAFPGARLFLRQTTPHDRPAPFDFVELVFGQAPFTAESEIALFKELHIDTVMCRNLGGRASKPKLDAAAALGLRAILLDRPAMPAGLTVVSDVDAALAWIDAL